MMTNLFSVFDPSSTLASLSWGILFTMLSFVVPATWILGHPHKTNTQKALAIFKKEVTFTLKKGELGVTTIIMVTFLFILLANFLALYPQVFSATSHLTITLPLSLASWLAIVMFGWSKNTNHMLAHLVPQGTPPILMSFMVMIEMTSNLIRPITLCVRLTANLIAGHLLMSLLGNALMSVDSFLAVGSMPAPLLLTVLESAVACIQAYVFMTLTALYITEVKYDKKI